MIEKDDITYYDGSDNILIVVQNDGDNKYHYLPRRKNSKREHNTKRIGEYLFNRMNDHNLSPSLLIVDMNPIHICTDGSSDELMRYATSKVFNTYSYFYDLINRFSHKHKDGIILDIHKYRSSSYRSLIQIGTLCGLTFDKNKILSNYFFENSRNELFMGGYLLQYIYQNHRSMNAVQLSYPIQNYEDNFSEDMYRNASDLIIESFVDTKWELRIPLPPSPRNKDMSNKKYLVKSLVFMIIFLFIYFIENL